LDPTHEPTALSRRARRGVTLIAVSLTVIVVASLLYLHPKLGTTAQPTPKPSPTPPILAGTYKPTYSFATPSIGWALVVVGGPDQTHFWIFKTTDGAKRWVSQYEDRIEAGSPQSLQIRFFDTSHGFVIAGADTVLRTRDGGNHWKKLTAPLYGLTAAVFADPMHGWLRGLASWDAGNPITHLVSTADGGDTWTKLPAPPAVSEIVFRNPSEGYAGGMDRAKQIVYSSNDGGKTWTIHELPTTIKPVAGQPWTSPHVRPIPGAGVLALVGGAAYASFDGGESWRDLVQPPAVSYYEVAFEDARRWWAMRQEGDLYKTSDSGQSWARVSAHQLDGLRFAIGIIDAKHAWVRFAIRGTQQGSGLALTSDGGVHWTYANVPVPP
jgi:photosystem II stability/assembly factor-like uncharacterized protein